MDEPPKQPPKQPPKISWEYATPYKPPPITQYIHLMPIERYRVPDFIVELKGTPQEILEQLVKMMDENEKIRSDAIEQGLKIAERKSKLYKNEK
jgi:hypothetical protein